MFIVLLTASQILAAPATAIEQVHGNPEAFRGRLMRLCGEVSPDQKILYSDTHYRFHGRVGVQLRADYRPGRNQCVTGRLARTEDASSAGDDRVLVTDAPVHPDYLFIAEPASTGKRK